MKFRKPREGPRESVPGGGGFGAELLEGRVTPRQSGGEPRAEDLHGELQPQPVTGGARLGLRQRFGLAFFALRKFQDVGMALASFIPPSRHGEYLQKKDCAFINRSNLYDFHRAAKKHLLEFRKSRDPGELRSFCDNFVKVERFEKLHAASRMYSRDERRLAHDQDRYMEELSLMADDLVVGGWVDRGMLEKMLERSGNFLI